MPLSDIVAQLEAEVRPVDMVLDRTATAQLEQAQRRLDRATAALADAEQSEQGQMAKPSTATAKTAVAEAQEAFDAAQERARARRVTFHLRELGGRRWRELMWLLPPTKDQVDRLGRQLDHNPELFPIVAIAFSLVDVDEAGQVIGPSLPADELEELDVALKKAAGDPGKAVRAVDANLPQDLVKLNDRLRSGGWEKLTTVLYQLNLEVSQVPLSLSASDGTPSS